MPTLRPLAFALATTLVVSLTPQSGHAAKRPAPRRPAAACNDFYLEANKGWLAANQMPATGAVSVLGELATRAQQQQRDLLDAAMQSP